MKIVKLSISVACLYALFLTFFTSQTSCSKNTTVTVHDTTIQVVKDTITVIDSLFNDTAGLVAYYNFNGGNLNDSSGHHNNISFNNATLTSDRLGNANNAYL